MPDAYIIDAVRTPRGVGKPGKGALSHLHPQHLAAREFWMRQCHASSPLNNIESNLNVGQD